ncbi:MAG: DUF4336 domain-containing protein [Rhizobiaceae bacterium]|nr:DUF4336 domain-containing protein [Rhizobiaceae bacterium]
MVGVPESFGPNIWVADGPTVVAAAGFHYPTRMCLMRLANADLVVWSPVALSEQLREAVQAIGPVRFLVAPNSLHHSFLGDWQKAYPEALVFAPPGLREKRPDIRFDGDLAEGAMAAWEGEIDVAIVRGNRITTEVVLFHRDSATAIFADLLQQFPAGWFKGWRALVARLDLMVAAEPQVPRKFRLAFTDRQAAREGLGRVLAWPVQNVVMAHGPLVRGGGREFLKRAFGWLTGG